MAIIRLTKDEATVAVRRYNELFGGMDEALGCLAGHARESMRQRHISPAIEGLIWTVKSWWGVQGVRTETRAAMANALQDVSWPEGSFEQVTEIPEGAEEFAADLVQTVVRKTQKHGGNRKEVSLASKVLHWLLPWHVPVYDSYVAKELGVSASDLLKSYREVARLKVEASKELATWGKDWFGEIGPPSPLRALDKCLWWQGGGEQGKAVVVTAPWKALNKLGLATCPRT